MAKRQEESELKRAIFERIKWKPRTFAWINRTTGIPLGNGEFRPNDQAGIADITGVKCGRAFAFEIKTLKGKVSEKQLQWLIAFDRAGGYSAVLRSVEDFNEAWEEI